MDLASGTAVHVSMVGSRDAFEGTAVSASGRTVKLKCARPVAAGAVVSIDSGEALMLGEVCAARPAGQVFEMTVELEQMVYHADLARLAQALLSEPEPRER